MSVVIVILVVFESQFAHICVMFFGYGDAPCRSGYK